MDSIKRKVLAARRRLMLSQFCRALCWALTAGWFVAAIAILLRAIGYWPELISRFETQAWTTYWVGGATASAFVGSLIWTWARRPSLTAVAATSMAGLESRNG